MRFDLQTNRSLFFSYGIPGLASAILLVVNGDILGFSGIITSVSTAPQQAFSSTSQQWKIVFVSTFLITSNLFDKFAPESVTRSTTVEGHSISAIGYVLSGILCGFGTKVSRNKL
jgi:hypothetical protein